MEDSTIIEAIDNLKSKKKAPIVRQVGAYIVLAQNEKDFSIKARKINRKDTDGFYTINEALKL